MLFDSHAHLNYEGFDKAKRAAFIKEIEVSDVSHVVDIGYDLESSALAAKHAEEYPWCYATVGFHPHDSKKMEDTDLDIIKALAKKPKVVAIGEAGLDFYRNHSPQDVQKECFRKQIRLAVELKMPLVVHSRDADLDTMNILKGEGAFSNIRVLLHCFSGSKETAKQYIKLGAMISIAGPVTYSKAKKTVEVVEEIPIEYLLIETDAPYLTPEPVRTERNKVPYIKYTAQKIADIKGISFEEAARITHVNAKRFYGID